MFGKRFVGGRSLLFALLATSCTVQPSPRHEMADHGDKAPDVRGMSSDDAFRILRSAGYTIITLSTLDSDGHIIQPNMIAPGEILLADLSRERLSKTETKATLFVRIEKGIVVKEASTADGIR